MYESTLYDNNINITLRCSRGTSVHTYTQPVPYSNIHRVVYNILHVHLSYMLRVLIILTSNHNTSRHNMLRNVCILGILWIHLTSLCVGITPFL